MIKEVVALTIAGSDSSGGAGIQADLKTFAAFGVHGCCAITSVTAQNRQGVHACLAMTPEIIGQQIKAILDDFKVGAIKIGMVANAEIISSIAQILRDYPDIPVILDPVMIASTGDILLDQSALSVLKEKLIPVATLLTPNLHEAKALVNLPLPVDEYGVKDMLSALKALGSRAVLLKGGHSDNMDHSNDFLFDGIEASLFKGPRIKNVCTHGTGCTLSSACAALMAGGEKDLKSVIKTAKSYLISALKQAGNAKSGCTDAGLNHLYLLDKFPHYQSDGQVVPR